MTDSPNEGLSTSDQSEADLLEEGLEQLDDIETQGGASQS